MASSLHLGNQPNPIRRPPGPSRSGSPASRPPSVLPSRSRPCAGHADLVPQTPQSEVWFRGSGQEADSPPSYFPRCTHSVRVVTRMPSHPSQRPAVVHSGSSEHSPVPSSAFPSLRSPFAIPGKYSICYKTVHVFHRIFSSCN